MNGGRSEPGPDRVDTGERPKGRDPEYWHDEANFKRKAKKVYAVLRDRYPNLAAEQPEFDKEWGP